MLECSPQFNQIALVCLLTIIFSQGPGYAASRIGKEHISIIANELFSETLSVSSEHQDLVSRDFPGGPVVKNLPSNAGDMGSIPGRGIKIPHAVGQLSPCATTTEHVGHN